MTTVVAAVIERDGKILICRRRADQAHPLKWEFPGGKAEPGEHPLDSLRRELREELGIEIGPAAEITRLPYQYPARPPILLIFYRVEQFSGPVQNRVFAEIRWAPPAELPSFDFLEADIDFVRSVGRASARAGHEAPRGSQKVYGT